MGELLARLKAALRHGLQAVGEAPVFRAGSLSVDLVNRRVQLGEKDVHLSPREYSLLRFLVGPAGKVVTHRSSSGRYGVRPMPRICNNCAF
jgi:two-component system, OmpR family, KDP operon response regulator KdpE